jgi:hypothetical protein
MGDTYIIGMLTNHLSAYVVGVAPAITNINPSSGIAGTAITITGTNFHTNATVTIGGMPATATVDDTETISAVVPGIGAGTQAVIVTNPDMLSSASSFTVTVAGGGGGTAETYVPTGGGGGLGNGNAVVPIRGKLVKEKTETVTEDVKPVSVPVARPAAPTVSQVITRIITIFSDAKNHWAESYINRLYTEDIISGKTATTFAPNDPISRAELIKIALKAFVVPIPSRVSDKPFPDVEVSAWYAPYAVAAKKYGILKGFPEGMRPNELVSRAEALKILLTASKLPLESASVKNFTDTSPGAWYMYYVRYAYENGIISGYTDGTFRPSATITRAEIAKMTVKVMDLVLQ